MSNAQIATSMDSSIDGEEERLIIGEHQGLRCASILLMAACLIPYIMTIANMATLVIFRMPELTIKGQTMLSMMAPDLGPWGGAAYFLLIILIMVSVAVFQGKRSGLIGPVLSGLFALSTIVLWVMNSIPAV